MRLRVKRAPAVASAQLRTVAALYIDPLGPYPVLEGVECWDETRNAKLYEGPYPVVAHPPCGPWGRLKFMCTRQDRAAGPAAVNAVRRWGGVVEHPEHSHLWKECSMPWPGDGVDGFGGRTYLVRQVNWGHPAEKPTWLYVVGVDPELVVSAFRYGAVATRKVLTGPTGTRGKDLPRIPYQFVHLTPRPFAEWLVSLARAVKQAPPVLPIETLRGTEPTRARRS